MKRSLVFFMAVFVVSCDYVKDPRPQNNEITDGAPTFAQNTNTIKHVLLEEYTGFRCPNCPGASSIANRVLKPQFEDTLFVVAIHASSLAEPVPGTDYETDYTTDAGDVYYYFPSWNISAWVPVGTVDRKPYNSAIGVDQNDWEAAINISKNDTLVTDLQSVVNYDSVSRIAEIWVETEFKISRPGDQSLIIYVVEDSIIDWQINSAVTGDPNFISPEDSMYVHRHVLRDNVNGTWGTRMTSNGAAVQGEKIVKGFQYTVPSGYNQKNVIFIIYVYDENSKEVLQVIEKHLVE